MIVNTKFDLGQEVYFMYDNKVQHAEILEIKIVISVRCKNSSSSGKMNTYELGFSCKGGGNKLLNESELFASKEELLSSL